MKIWVRVSHETIANYEVQVSLPASIGRAEDCELRLRHWRVARRHAVLDQVEGHVAIEDLGSLAGTLVNGRRVGRSASLLPDDHIEIAGYHLRVGLVQESPQDAARSGAPALALAEAELAGEVGVDSGREAGTAAVAEPPGEFHRGEQTQAQASSGHVGTDELRLFWRRKLQQSLREAMDLRRRDVAGMSDAALRHEADRLLAALIDGVADELPAGLDRDALRRDVLDEAVGLGPLERLLADRGVSEIMVNRHDEIFVEREGRLSRHHTGFSSERAVLSVIERIVAPLGRRIDESSPMVDARLADGSRVNAVIAPIALKGASLTIRKFPDRRLGLDDLLQTGALNEPMAQVLRCCVQQRCNLVVSGGTGSGKTTLLNILSEFIPSGERIVTIEDAAELKLQHDHLVALEARPANLEGRGLISIRDLVRNALRMRPDRIVVGECRGAEALDMLQAMNTGHEGSLTTLHANTPRDALIRLESMLMMANANLPLLAIRRQIASAVHLIVQIERSRDGKRRITHISEIVGMESETIMLQDLFMFNFDTAANYGDGVRGSFECTGLRPNFSDTARYYGLEPQLMEAIQP